MTFGLALASRAVLAACSDNSGGGSSGGGGTSSASSTRDAFVELSLHTGCEALPYFETMKATEGKALDAFISKKCSRMRQDGLFIEAGENGYLVERGLTPLSDELRARTRDLVLTARSMEAPIH